MVVGLSVAVVRPGLNDDRSPDPVAYQSTHG